MKKKFIIPLLFLASSTFYSLTTSAQTPTGMGAILTADNRFEIYAGITGDHGGVYQTLQIVPNGSWLSTWNQFTPAPDYLAHGLVAGRDRAGRSMVAWISNGDIFVAAAKKPNQILTMISNTSPMFPKQSEEGKDFAFNYLQLVNRPMDGKLELLALNERGRVFSMVEQDENPAAVSMTFSNPVPVGGGLLQSISVTTLDKGLALVATGTDKKVWLKSQTVPGIWDHDNDVWTDLGGNQVERAYARESATHQLQVVALGGDRSLYLNTQNVGGTGFSGWRMILDQRTAERRAPAIFFDWFKDSSMFVVSHMDHGSTQYVGSFGKTFQPKGSDWTGIQFSYHEPARPNATYDQLSAKAITMIKDATGNIHYFACQTLWPTVNHYIDFSGATNDQELNEDDITNPIPKLPWQTNKKKSDGAPEN